MLVIVCIRRITVVHGPKIGYSSHLFTVFTTSSWSICLWRYFIAVVACSQNAMLNTRYATCSDMHMWWRHRNAEKQITNIQRMHKQMTVFENTKQQNSQAQWVPQNGCNECMYRCLNSCLIPANDAQNQSVTRSYQPYADVRPPRGPT